MGILFYNTIKQVGIFIICAQAIMHFKQNESYDKYLKMLVSMMILVQILTPMFSIFQDVSMDDFSDKISMYTKELEVQMEEIELIEVIAEERVKEKTYEEIEKRVQEEKNAMQDSSSGNLISIEKVEVKKNE